MSKAKATNDFCTRCFKYSKCSKVQSECTMADSYQEGYEDGYQQAEKDLTDISWIKEVSGVKELSRAKEEALKAYPPRSIAANYGTIDRRDAFEYGYLKAQKDNELTWEDLATLEKLGDDFVKNNQTPMSDKEYYEEILKRFNKERKVKNNSNLNKMKNGKDKEKH